MSRSSKYNLGSKLAELCLDLGYSDSSDLGYQTFLYSNDKELRKIFLFLLEKLPKVDKEEEVAITAHHCEEDPF